MRACDCSRDGARMRKRKYSPLESCLGDSLDGCPIPTVHNIVATAQIESSLPLFNLDDIHVMLPCSFYDQERFAAITIRLYRPECTTLLFSSGKLVVTGCKHWYESVYASLFMTRLLSECIPGHTFRLVACDIQNMVAHVEVPIGSGYLDLQAMYSKLAINCTYQRKMFPGLIFRPEASPVVLLCFFSGKVVITGGKNMHDVYSGWRKLWPVLRDFIRPSELREHKEGLPLEGHAVADQALGGPEALEQATRGRGRRGQIFDLADPAELERFCDHLTAEA